MNIKIKEYTLIGILLKLSLYNDLEDANIMIDNINSNLTIEQIPTSDIVTPVSGVTVSSRACWKVGKFVFLNAVFTISNPTQGVNDLATYKPGYAPPVTYIQPTMSYAAGNDAGSTSLLNLKPTNLDVEHTGAKPYLLVSVIYKVA